MKKIIITGGSGFLGTAITKRLLEMGSYDIVVMDIAPPRVEHEHVSFFKKNLLEPFDLQQDYALLKNPYAIIHLSGKSIFGRFTDQHKQLIRNTRVLGTRHLVDLFARDDYRPQTLVAASAVGFYGDQSGEVLVESSEPKNRMFLSQVVEDWEEENLRAREYGVAVTCIRNGHILGKGGLLGVIQKQFRFGIGTMLGNGKASMPWIDIDDLIELYIAGTDGSLPAVINGVSGTHETQKDFSHAIGAIKNTKIYLPIPRFALRIKFGDFADEMLVDQHVISEHIEPYHLNLEEVVKKHLVN